MHVIPWKGSKESESNKHGFISVNNVHVTSALINHPMIIIWFTDKIAKSKSPFYLTFTWCSLWLSCFYNFSGLYQAKSQAAKTKQDGHLKEKIFSLFKNLFPNDIGMGLYLHLSFEEHAQY